MLENKARKRPTSPHLTIYKWQISSVLSIGHRISGVAVFFTILLSIWSFAYWVFIGLDAAPFAILTHPIVKLLLILASFSFFYHFSIGIRHLIWNSGYFFSINSVNITGWLALLLSIILTSIFWCCCLW